MQTRNQQYASTSSEADAEPPYVEFAEPLYTVSQFRRVEPSNTEAAIRNLIFKSKARHSSRGSIPGNGLQEAGAIIRVGRKVLIDRPKWRAWQARQNEVSE